MTWNQERTKFYTEIPTKLIIFSFFSVGVYNMYFFYRIFLLNHDDSPRFILITKSILYPIFCFRLLKKTSEYSGEKLNPLIKSVLLWTTLIIFVYAGGLFEGHLKFLAFATFIPLLGINMQFKRANSI